MRRQRWCGGYKRNDAMLEGATTILLLLRGVSRICVITAILNGLAEIYGNDKHT